MTPRCPLCGGVVVGSHFHGLDPEQRCDACDTLADLRGAAVCACSLAALRRALAEQAAGEAERVAAAVARAARDWDHDRTELTYELACADEDIARARREAYEDAAQIADRYGHAHIADAIRARATSPAPEPHPAERAVVEAAEAWRASLDGPGECWHEARMREAVDALAAARKGGE